LTSVYNVYQEYIWNGREEGLAKKLYRDPVLTLDGLYERAPSLIEAYRETLWHIPERMEQVRAEITKANDAIGCLTPKVSETIEMLEFGAVESAHQSVALGGAGYVLNKAATARRVSVLCSEKGLNLAPFFCVADYDEVQPELTNIRTPLMGSDGNLISVPVPEGYEHSPVSALPLPEYDWYAQVEESIRDNYHPMFKVVEGTARAIYEERLEQALSLTRWAFVRSGTLGEWAQRIIGRLFNIEGNLGIPIVPASKPGIRDLLVEGLEMLLSRENRELLLKSFEEATALILENGYVPGVGSRDSSYVPFFYECHEKSCHSSRIELTLQEQGSDILLTGKCPVCGDTVEIETSAESPYLAEFARDISPRVDSRQFVLDTIIPTVAHIGGPGETAYYAQVIPGAEAIGVPFPEFVKYPRIYFNTAWNEDLGKNLASKEFAVLHGRDLFSLLGRIAKSRRKNKFDEMNGTLSELHQFITKTHLMLNNQLRELQQRIEAAPAEEMENLRNLKLDVERYLSWVFGQYAPSKLGQESSWSWIEWAVNSGFPDLMGPYERAYVGEMKNGATLFVNFNV
jgi:uncharacterized protein YllA (UPF0747 family)